MSVKKSYVVAGVLLAAFIALVFVTAPSHAQDAPACPANAVSESTMTQKLNALAQDNHATVKVFDGEDAKKFIDEVNHERQEYNPDVAPFLGDKVLLVDLEDRHLTAWAIVASGCVSQAGVVPEALAHRAIKAALGSDS